jgi:hypothetical protein
MKLKVINRDALKILAMAFMLLDHMWATVIPGNQWMTFVGRMAFPIFAFQIAEGFVYTSDFSKYAKRLLVFAIVAEVPFNLFYSSSLLYPFHQNVLFTLLLGLLAIRFLDNFAKERTPKNGALAVIVLLGTTLAASLGMTDYGATGVWTVVLFYLTKDRPYSWLLQLAGMYLLNVQFFSGMYIPVELFGKVYEFQTQGFAILSLIPIHLYNGKKGSGSKVLQYGMYVFYPLHMFILYLVHSNM